MIPLWLRRAIERKPDRPRVTSFEHLSDDELENVLAETKVRLDLLVGLTNGFARQGAEVEVLRSLQPAERTKLKGETLKVMAQIRRECRRREGFRAG
jgi:hypothetical protein